MLSFLLPSENWEDLLRVVFKTSLTSEAQCSACAGCPWRLKDTLNWEQGQGGCDSSLPPPSLPWMCLCVSALIYLLVSPSVCAHILLQCFAYSFCWDCLIEHCHLLHINTLSDCDKYPAYLLFQLIIIVWNRIESSNFLCEDSPRGFTGTSLC